MLLRGESQMLHNKRLHLGARGATSAAAAASGRAGGVSCEPLGGMMQYVMLALAVLIPALPTSAWAAEKERHPYFKAVPGRFVLIGQFPDGGATYKGTAEITDRNGRLHLVKHIDGKDVTAEGTVERAAPGEADVLRFKWTGHAATCLVGSDLDNYSRLTCYWTINGAEHKRPGLEAYFPAE